MKDEDLRSVRPYQLDADMDESIRMRVNQHTKELCNVLYSKGDYYIYQSDSLLKQAGLTTELGQKTTSDRYFVTN